MLIQAIQAVFVRPTFQQNAILTKENYGSIVAKVVLPDSEEGRCQLLKVRSACASGFQKGWLISLAEGGEVLLGGCCAKNHFGLEQFNREASTFERALKSAEMQERFSAHLADQALRQRLGDLSERYRRVDRAVAKVRQGLPGTIFLQLLRMANSSRPTSSYRVEYFDENDKGEEVSKLEWRRAGPLRGLSIFAPYTLSTARTALENASRALDHPDKTLGSVHLKKRLKHIEAIDSIPRQLETIESAFLAFDTLDNYLNVALLANDAEGRERAAALGLSRSRMPSSERDAQRALQEFQGRLSQEEGGRRVIF